MVTTWERLVAWLRSDGSADAVDGAALAAQVSEAYRREVLPPLLVALKSPSPHVVRAACGAVRKLGAEAAPAVPLLTAIAQSPLPRGADIQQEYARMDALHAMNDILGEIERVRAREAKRTEDAADEARRREEAERRTALARAEGEARRAEADATRAAADAVLQRRRLEAAETGAPAPPEHPRLDEDDDDEALDPSSLSEVRSRVDALALLLEAARDPDAGVREAVWDALATAGARSEAVLAAARIALRDPEPNVRRAVARALANR